VDRVIFATDRLLAIGLKRTNAQGLKRLHAAGCRGGHIGRGGILATPTVAGWCMDGDKELRDEWDDQGITPWTSDHVDRCIVGLLDGGVGIRPRIW
jgi:hypothetical protein